MLVTAGANSERARERPPLRHASRGQPLTEAGFSEPQAETVTDVLREARQSALSNLADKTELAALGAR